MIHAILPFLTAIALSTIAAYYSVIGLAQIFPGSYWPIIIMGSVLEAAKLVTVSWLHTHWKDTFSALKLYFLIAVILLMAITTKAMTTKGRITKNQEIPSWPLVQRKFKNHVHIATNKPCIATVFISVFE
jgi:hypothetical protein